MKNWSIVKTLILAFIIPGFGYLYLGYRKLAFLTFALFIISVKTLYLFNYQSAQQLFFAYSIFLGIFLFPIIHSGKISLGGKYKENKKSSLLLYLIFFIVGIGATFNLKNDYTFKIPTESMVPTVIKNDVIYVEQTKKVNRGDVIVFKYPKNPNIRYLKRIIAVPGDILEIKDGNIYINGEVNPTIKEQEIPTLKILSEKFHKYKFKMHTKKINGKEFDILRRMANPYPINFPSKKIGLDEYFVLGDNRDFSHDSRFWGTVPLEYIIGKAKFILTNYDQIFSSSRINKKVN